MKGKGISAAAWFYSQPGFHAPVLAPVPSDGERATVVAEQPEFDIDDVMEGWHLARRWAALKMRVLALRREREQCDAYEPANMGDPTGVPHCWEVHLDAPDTLPFEEWCGACQRNQARYLYRQYTQKALAQAQRKLLKALA